MEHEKNLHASIPNALLADAQRFAEAQHISVDELVCDAMERRIRDLRRQKLYAYGDAQARELGIREEDVERIVHQHREERTGREH